MNLQINKTVKTFGGDTVYYAHDSTATKTTMNFSVFIPKAQGDERRTIDSAIIWLSGLTCTEDNFITKSGVQRYLKDSNTMIICPDTSPRGLDLADEHTSYDFGSGAGFYVNATSSEYSYNYNMYDYVAKELMAILKDNFSISKVSLMGHSMGGHGALVLGLREKNLFSSISAFSPIVNPIKSPWGQKAFKGYFNSEKESYLYDATELLKSGLKRADTILIDQGSDDEFLETQLLTENFVSAAKNENQPLEVNYRKGYDHSYFFIASFIEEHINFHLRALNKSS